MTIVCLGWGSLIWNPGDLPVQGAWHTDGPPLPLEFARQSLDGRVTLVIADGALALPTLWCELSSPDLDSAAAALASREGMSNTRAVGSRPARRGEKASQYAGTIDEWASRRDFEGVVWTALRPRWEGVNGRFPKLVEVVDYLRNLPASKLTLAADYIRKAPDQIETNYRPTLVETLSGLAV